MFERKHQKIYTEINFPPTSQVVNQTVTILCISGTLSYINVSILFFDLCSSSVEECAGLG